MHIFSSGTVDQLEPKERSNFHRVFWICSVILHELEAILKLHPIGLRQFHEVVPLPLTDYEDEGYYFFFAQASLRKLLTETLDVVGYRVGQVIYAPVVAGKYLSLSSGRGIQADHKITQPSFANKSTNGTRIFRPPSVSL
jgi:hypothetical protein